MKEHVFTIDEALQEGWRLTKNHLKFLIAYQIILYLLIAAIGLMYTRSEGAFWNILGWGVLTLGKMGFYQSALLLTARIQPQFDQLYKNWKLLFAWVVASCLFSVMLVIGLALFIVPGLYVWSRYGFYPFFILDRHSGPLEALSQAAQATKNLRWQIFWLLLTCTLINLLGLLCFGIGVLLTAPLTLLALASVYRKMVFLQKPTIYPQEISLS